MKQFTIGPNDAGQRIDQFVGKVSSGLPTSLLYKAFRNKRVKVNHQRARFDSRLSAGDIVTLYLNDEFFPPADRDMEYAFLSAPPHVKIVYEDANLLIADKPAGLLAHGHTDSLLLRLQHLLYQRGEFDPHLEHTFSPALCNRLDRNTAGLIMAAKNAPALRMMNEKIKAREVTKLYICRVAGIPSPPAQTLRHYLRKDSHSNQVLITDKPITGAKAIVTRYRMVQAYENTSLLEVELITGRTHQIRAHLAYIGHPICGDMKYGNAALKTTGQELTAYKLRFDFPTDAGELDYLRGKEFSL